MSWLACLWLCLTCFAPQLPSMGPIVVRPEDGLVIPMALVSARRMAAGSHTRSGAGAILGIGLLGLSLGFIGLMGSLLALLGGDEMSVGTFGHDAGQEVAKELFRVAKYFALAVAFA